MSLAQILEEVKSFPISDIETLEQLLRLERLQRMGTIASPAESELLRRINAPLPQTERFARLRIKLQNDTLSDAERDELIAISEEREVANAGRAEAVMELATLQGRPFKELWNQMVGAPQGARFIAP